MDASDWFTDSTYMSNYNAPGADGNYFDRAVSADQTDTLY
jgi:hypothetical protein